jgi:DNA-binding PucR family transcriptional regulator
VEGAAQVTVVAFDASTGDTADHDGVQDVQVTERLADLVALHLESYRRSAAITTLGRRVYALVAEPDTATPPRRRAVVDEIVERARHSLQRRVVSGIGGTMTDLRQVVTSREEADSVVHVLRRRRDASVAHIDDVRTSVVLDRLRTAVTGDDRLQAGLLERLRAHDERHHSDYVITVAAYLSAFGAVAEAAERLVLHPNTLRYRLRRIAESTGVDLADPETRFVLELELRMAGLMGPGT